MVLVVVGLGGAIAVKTSSANDPPPKPPPRRVERVPDAPQPTALVALVDPAPSDPAPRPVEDAGAAEPPRDDAGLEAAPDVPDAGLVAALPNPPEDPQPVRPPVRGRGKLSLKTKPRATVYLNGRRIGDTPIVKLSVPAGLLKLRLVRADTRAEHVLEVEVLPNRTTVRNFTF